MPEGFDANETKNEYFVVSSVVLRQLPETYGERYGERYGGPLSRKVRETSGSSWRIPNETTNHFK